MRNAISLPAFAIVISAAIAQAGLAAPRVEFELAMEAESPLDSQRRWIDVLKDLDVRLRIRQARGSEEIKVTNRGTEASPSYHVLGVITENNTLLLPGGRFGMRDKAAINAWIEKLRDDGIEGLTATTGAFGLTAKQLVDVHKDLGKKVTFETKGKRAFDVASQLARMVDTPVALDAGARQVLSGEEIVADELRGLSAGTAMAAVLRPLGLVMMPEKPKGQEVQLAIVGVRSAKQSWPVGWPPEEAPGKIMPAMFRRLSVEIDDIPLTDALDAVNDRVKSPFLFDYNSMARHRVEPAKVNVSMPSRKTYYRDIIKVLLSQAKLTSEIRVDEAGTPFLWITTKLR